MFALLLTIAGILSLIVYLIDPVDYSNLAAACALFAVVVLMALVSFFEERKSMRVCELNY
jgi:hypothetical protein